MIFFDAEDGKIFLVTCSQEQDTLTAHEYGEMRKYKLLSSEQVFSGTSEEVLTKILSSKGLDNGFYKVENNIVTQLMVRREN